VKRTRSFTSPDQLPELLDLAAETAKPAGLSDALIFKAQVVLEELFTNIFRHGYRERGGTVEVALETEGRGMLLRVADWGPPFDPLSEPAPDLRKRFAEGLPGGAGLVLVRSMVANPRYTREEDCNVLRLRVEE
jgi:anti-sigma regulatory factor (Ser/Thr protein kinase)